MPNLLGNNKYGFIIGLSICVITFLVYANSLGNGFVWDDDLIILANSALKGDPVALFSGIDKGRSTDITPYYRPLALFTFLLDGRLHGFSPQLVRLFNVLLHSANALLVYRLARSLNLGPFEALFAGLLFAVHPIQSEAVDFNSARNTLLAAFFVLAAYLVHLWSANRDAFSGVCAGATLFLAGLFSKETAIAILPFIVVIEFSILRAESQSSKRKAVIRLLPYIVCLVIYLFLRENALTHAGASIKILPGLATRLLDNVYIIPRYLLNVAWPSLLSPRYFIPDDLNLYALPLACAWLCIIVMLWWFVSGGRSRISIFGLAWLVAFWLPVSGIFAIPSAPLADRYMYAPAIGLWLLLAEQFSCLLPPHNKVRGWGIGAVVFALIVLAAVTVRHNRIWLSDVSLFSRIIELNPDQAGAHHGLGCAYLDKDKNIELAEREFERAFALNPYFPRLRTQMGYARLLRGDLEGALQHYNHAIYQNGLDPEALLNRGNVLERLGRHSDAVDSYRRFLETPGSDLPEARCAIALKMMELSQKFEANRHGESK